MKDFRFAHVGVAVADISKALESYKDIFGFELISGPFDDPIQHVTVCFIGNSDPGEPRIELITPLDDASPVHRILRGGGGGYHFCYEVPDIEEAVLEARKKGSMVVSQPVPAVAFGGRRIAWIYLPSHQLIELLERGN